MNNEKKFIKLTPFKMQVLQSFPFIDEDFDAITNYELLCKVVDYLNKTIDNVDVLNDEVEEYINKFNELKAYVDNYFTNLDVQDEINNKLDEMVEDGTLPEIVASYLNSKAVFGFDSLASMKQATNLINGSYAETLGYYSKNDGGSALYKIRNITNDDVVDEMTIISMQDNTLIAELIFTNEMNLIQFGIKNDESIDVTSQLNNMFSKLQNCNVINFEQNAIYKITNTINIPVNIKINGNNATIKPYNDGLNALYINNDNNEIKNTEINNLNIDGIETTQDKFDETTYSNLHIITGLNIVSNNVKLNNVNLKNFYGNGICVYKCKEFNANFVNFDNVGGRWYNNTYDAFGDAFYFNNSKPELNVTIKDCNATLKYKNDVFSRGGLVLERNADYPEADTFSNVTIINSKLLNCDRCLHLENQIRKTNLEINNTKFYGHVWCINADNREDNKLFINNSEFKQSGGSYGGTRGFRNCKINAQNCYFDTYNTSDALFMDSDVEIDECTIDNISSTIFTNCLKNKIKNTNFNVYTNHYLRYSGNPAEIENCTFNNLTNKYINENGTVYNIINNSIFNNYLPKISNGENNKFYTSDDTVSINYEQKGMGVTLYLNNNIKSLPKSFKLFNYENDFLTKYYKDVNISDGNAHTLVDDSRIIENGKKYLLLIVGTASTTGLYDRITSGFDYCIVTKEDNNLSISTPTTVGSYSAGYNITIDNVNNTITKVGSYATKYQSLLVPYEYINCIGLI